jgi:hypothetical protein
VDQRRAGLIAGFLGASSKLIPTINEKFPPPHDTKMRLFQTRSWSGVTIVVALFLTLYGLIRSKPSINNATA